ncbi:hypothetical protein BIW11_02917 [Tropilaelaps mercedesae]|uniref:Uncharacterized protein n=1 Tax=Tropilaelaps mercedesae TaxID=418985 RepID=A0A1V9XV53_9ACAR|nr:hypothetical protein BIW11_02917 [Tropilaelaps mercedesae]
MTERIRTRPCLCAFLRVSSRDEGVPRGGNGFWFDPVALTGGACIYRHPSELGKERRSGSDSATTRTGERKCGSSRGQNETVILDEGSPGSTTAKVWGTPRLSTTPEVLVRSSLSPLDAPAASSRWSSIRSPAPVGRYLTNYSLRREILKYSYLLIAHPERKRRPLAGPLAPPVESDRRVTLRGSWDSYRYGRQRELVRSDRTRQDLRQSVSQRHAPKDQTDRQLSPKRQKKAEEHRTPAEETQMRSRVSRYGASRCNHHSTPPHAAAISRDISGRTTRSANPCDIHEFARARKGLEDRTKEEPRSHRNGAEGVITCEANTRGRAPVEVKAYQGEDCERRWRTTIAVGLHLVAITGPRRRGRAQAEWTSSAGYPERSPEIEQTVVKEWRTDRRRGHRGVADVNVVLCANPHRTCIR